MLYLAGKSYITYKEKFHHLSNFFIFVLNLLKDVEFLYPDGNLAQRNGAL